MAATASSKTIRLGSQHGSLGHPQLLHCHEWRALAEPTGANQWELEFVTPVTFRTGNRSSPLTTPSAVLHRLGETWSLWSGMPARDRPRERAEAVWVSDIEGRSHTMTLGQLKVSAFVGRVTLRCDEPDLAAVIDPLLRLAAYAGTGSGTTKGLGVTRVAAIARRPTTTTRHASHMVPSGPTHGTQP
jgi:CRISPR-associated endoribonuclease Cas6